MRFSRPAAIVVVVLTSLSLVIPASAPAAAGRPSPAAAPRRDGGDRRASLDADEMRRELEDVLKAYPPSLPRILQMDPTLLNNEGYLQPYPALAAFLKQHPEVTHNPAYFFAQYGESGNYYRETPQDRAVNMWRSTIEGFTIGSVILAIASGVIWLIKMLIDHRRWSRLSKIQTEVHNKVLDRMQSNEDLLAYIQTPAGRRFLESAPIPIDSPRSIGAPLGRILWSAQAGAVLTRAWPRHRARLAEHARRSRAAAGRHGRHRRRARRRVPRLGGPGLPAHPPVRPDARPEPRRSPVADATFLDVRRLQARSRHRRRRAGHGRRRLPRLLRPDVGRAVGLSVAHQRRPPGGRRPAPGVLLPPAEVRRAVRERGAPPQLPLSHRDQPGAGREARPAPAVRRRRRDGGRARAGKRAWTPRDAPTCAAPSAASSRASARCSGWPTRTARRTARSQTSSDSRPAASSCCCSAPGASWPRHCSDR